MKVKTILITMILVFGFCCNLYADSKITSLTEMTDVQGSDILYVIDDPGGTPASKKITVTNLFDIIDTPAELETIANLGAFFSDYADDADAETMRATLGLTIGTNVQAYSATLLSLAGLTETNGGIPYGTADNAYAWLAAGAEGTLLMGNGAGAPSWLAAGTSGYTLVAAGAADPVWTQYLTVPSGGIGTGSLTDGGVLLGSGTGAITPMAVLADGEMIVGDGTTDPVAESGATLRTSIGVGTGDSPQFTGIELSHATENTLTASSGVLSIEGTAVVNSGGALGTPASGTLTNCTGLPNAGLIVTAGDSYINFSTSAADDTVDELMAALDVAIGNISVTSQRLLTGLTVQTFTGADATPDVSNNGTSLVQLWETVDTTTITDLDDGVGAFSSDATANHSGFANGDSIVIQCQTAQVFDLSSNANMTGHGGNDYTCAAGEFILAIFDSTNDYWVLKPSETKTANFNTLIFPNDESADGALTNRGQVHVRGDEDTINLHFGTGGEIAGEASLSGLVHVAIPVDFTYIYDRDAAHRLPLFVVNSKVYPNGITIDYISVKHIANRTTALDADLKRATDFQGTSAAVILALDVADGADEMAQDTDASINGGAVVAAGQHIYIEVSADPVDENNLATVEIIFHREAD